jgi:hypothetical protein
METKEGYEKRIEEAIIRFKKRQKQLRKWKRKRR